LKAIHRLLEQLHVISGSAELEQIPRYRLQGPVANPPWDLVQQTLSEGGKVLWVANTVDRTVGFAKQAQERGFPNVYPYHSRYRYMDRLRKHNAVVDAFRNDDREPVLAVTTQVCEVSLDLSADLLVSDLAPVPALIQRMGRLNRRVSPDNPGTPKAAIVLDPANALPYEEADLETARRWLQPLASDAPVSQAALAAAFEQLSQNVKVGDVESAWLDGGPFSRSAPLREAGVTVPVIRAEDESDCVDRGGRPIPKEITRRAIPMTLGPVAKEIGGWRRLGFVFVAPEGRVEYSSEWGARWARK